MQPHVQFCTFIEESCIISFPSAPDVWFKMMGGPLYRVIIVAPPTLAMVPRILANPSILVRLTCSILETQNSVAVLKSLLFEHVIEIPSLP